MKKFWIIFVSVILCLALVACSGGETSEEDTEEEDDYHYAVFDIEQGTELGTFKSTDLDGNKVSEAIFADKDATVINVWATFCGPCLGEMAELEEMSQNLPENAQIIGIVIDAPEGDKEMTKEAIDICKEKCVTYTNILASDSVLQMFQSVEAVPTTFILDKEGKTVCTPIVGADVDGYKKALNEYLN